MHGANAVHSFFACTFLHVLSYKNGLWLNSQISPARYVENSGCENGKNVVCYGQSNRAIIRGFADIGMGKSQRYQAAVDGHCAALPHWKQF